MVSEMFARRYPGRVAGMVFADAGNSEMLDIANSLGRGSVIEARTACMGVSAAGAVGVVRLLDPFALRRESSPDAERSAALMYRAQPWKALCALVRGVATSAAEFQHVPPLRPDLPLIVLSAERSDGLLPAGLVLPAGSERRGDLGRLFSNFQATHKRLASRSTRGSWQIVRGSGHLIASDQPQAVIDATVDVLAQARASATTTP